MKIMEIIPRLCLAGAETMCTTLSLQLKKNNENVIVVSLFDYTSTLSLRLENAGIKVIYLGKKNGIDLSIIPKLLKLFMIEKPDVIHTHMYVMPYVIPAAVFAGIKKRIHTVHSIADHDATPKVQLFNDFFFHHCSVLPVAISKEVRKSVVDRYKLPSSKVPVVLNGIDFSKLIIKKDYKINCKMRFIHVGRFYEAKNHRLLIKAFKNVLDIIHECELVLVGDGDLKKEIKQMVNKMGLSDNVVFLGETDEVAKYLSSADVFVFPSKWEGLGIALQEAMACGLPCIATNVGGIPDLIDNDVNGMLIEENVESLVSAMIKMADIEYRRKLGINARKKAEKYFSAKLMAERYIQVYK